MDVLRDYAPYSVKRYAYARHALVDALTRSGVGTGSCVALPAFICRDVLASVQALGAEVIFYDLDESLRPLDLTTTPAAVAILAVNYFGFPQDLTAFRLYCNHHQARLIEDNAHGLFSQDGNAALLGTRGDFGILSMRKSFHVSTGAALIAPPGTDLGIPTPCLNGTDAPLDRLRYLLSRCERKTSLPLMPLMRSTIRFARRLMGKPAVALSSAREEFELPQQQAIGCSSSRVLDEQSPTREAERRRQLFSRLTSELHQLPGVSLLYGDLEDGVVPYGIPFRADADAAAEVAKIARRYHVSTMMWPALPKSIEMHAPAHYSNVWLVNFI
jgi:hypothetical protein